MDNPIFLVEKLEHPIDDNFVYIEFIELLTFERYYKRSYGKYALEYIKHNFILAKDKLGETDESLYKFLEIISNSSDEMKEKANYRIEKLTLFSDFLDKGDTGNPERISFSIEGSFMYYKIAQLLKIDISGCGIEDWYSFETFMRYNINKPVPFLNKNPYKKW